MQGMTVLVTGASSGIGEAFARLAARRGANVALLARRHERLLALASELRAFGVEAIAERCDVTREAEVEGAVERSVQLLGGLDVVFANAGMGVGGKFTELSNSDYQRQFETNVFGVLRTIRASLPALRLRNGRIGVVGSVNGYVEIPGHSAYCMSKAAIRSLCACLRHELMPEGVSVTHLVPGFVKSEFRRAGGDGTTDPELRDPIPAWLAADSAPAAERMLAAVLARHEEAVITAHGKAAVALAKHAHWLLSATMGKSAPLIDRWSLRGPPPRRAP